MTAIVLGATAGLGRALCRAIAARGDDVALVGRHSADLAAEAANLNCRFGVKTFEIVADGSEPERLAAILRDRLDELGEVNALICPIGTSLAEDDGTIGLTESRQLVAVNLLSVVATVHEVLPSLIGRKSGVIVGFGSVAAVRGRGANVVYAAAKRGLESYFESLRHRLSGTGVRCQFYRLGYLDSGQSYGKRLMFPKASPQRIAEEVVANLDRDIGRITLPRYWTVVTLILRLVPWRIYRRLRY